MISHKYKCIFIEVPKTGSTSIRSIIGFSKKPHLDIKEIKEEFICEHYQKKSNFLIHLFKKNVDRSTWNQYFKFGFVRNPWDRIVSLYLRKEGIQMSDKMSFPEFVHWIQSSSDTSIHPTKHTNQLDWFLDDNKNLAVDYIGRFETLTDDWKIICKKLGIDEPLPHSNKNPENKKHYTEYYTDELKDIIANKFRVDIEYFNYEFGK